MFSSIMYLLFSVFIYICTIKSCTSELLLNAPSLYLYSPGELEFTDVLVKRVGDNLTLACELRGDTATVYVWNYVPQDNVVAERPYTIEKNGSSGSRLLKPALSLADSGRYVCSAPPFSVAKYILVQDYNGMSCAHGAFACGARCVLPAYVCDGRHDCLEGDDEAPDLCGPMPCARADRLNCSSGRCIPEAACCRSPHALCRQPACCLDQPRYNMHGAFMDVDMPPVFDDRHAPDDYGFIQSTIYTVTACALIFMIAVVLLVSAICKMHMKRAALRSYAHAHGPARAHRAAHYAQQRHLFPPCYEASGLLEHATHSPLPSPTHHDTQCGISAGSASPSASERRTRLAALTSVFTSRYRQVPTQCTEVEMTAVTSTATRSPSRTVEYRSPAGGAPSEGAPHLNVANEPTQTNRLTLQLGRFQLSIPRFGRPETRPDTPNVAEINIDDLEFVRLNSRETYTLNGRTIHLLGGNFENYPPLTHGSHPPPYNEAMRYKLYGPPPEYLSRDRLNRCNSVDEEARTNIEMPPCYDDLANGRGNGSGSNASGSNENGNGSTDFASAFGGNPIVINRDLIMSNIIENVSSGNNNNNNNSHFNNGEEACGGVIIPVDNNNENYTNISIIGVASTSFNNNENISQDDNSVISNLTNLIARSNDNITTNNVAVSEPRNDTVASITSLKDENENVESLNSVIDNLPAIDSDFNANDGVEVNC